MRARKSHHAGGESQIDFAGEVWKNFDEHTMVSNMGRCWYQRSGRWTKKHTPRPSTRNSKGTEYATMTLVGGKKMRVHKAVLQLFRGSPPTPRHVGDHLNGRCDDNREVNLVWATRSDQMARMYERKSVAAARAAEVGEANPEEPASPEVIPPEAQAVAAVRRRASNFAH